jgi:hypothetical protein
MKKLFIGLAAAGSLLAACDTMAPTPASSGAQDPITAALVNKTLRSTNTTLRTNEGNRLRGLSGPSGTIPISGAWEIRNGQFCRTLTDPPQMAGTECNDITIDGETATISGPRGTETYIISDE